MGMEVRMGREWGWGWGWDRCGNRMAMEIWVGMGWP